jgi:hypothetical protein
MPGGSMQVWVRINEGLKLSSSGQRAPSEALYLWSLNLKTASILNLIILGISLTIIYIP